MEIGITKKGDVYVLTLKGRIRREHWRVVDKHLGSLLDKGCRHLVLDLSEVPEMCTAGMGAIFGNIKRYRDRNGRLLLISPGSQFRMLCETLGEGPILDDSIFPDWTAAERRLDTLDRPSPEARPATGPV